MKNVTITLEPEIARWLQIRAAAKNTSVSRLVGELPKEIMASEDRYEVAMHQYLSFPPRRLKRKGASYPPREKGHERLALCRYKSP